MSYFSRLTDIVTCNLTSLLKNAEDPAKEIEQIIAEMNEGLAGVHRSVKSATGNQEAIEGELREHREQISQWVEAAKQALAAGDEVEARNSLVRKQEIEDLMAGLEQQHQAALATCKHLTTTLHALEARLSEAKRKQRELTDPGRTIKFSTPASADLPPDKSSLSSSRSEQIESELAALKRELGK